MYKLYFYYYLELHFLISLSIIGLNVLLLLFLHLADAFVQLSYFQGTHFSSVYVFPGNQPHDWNHALPVKLQELLI